MCALICSLCTYQNQHTYKGDVVNYAESLEFIDHKNNQCPSPSIKTKRTGEDTKIIVYFDTDKAELKESEREKILGVMGYPTRITGYTDSVGTVIHNKALAKKRAEVVAELLQSAKRFKLSTKAVAGKELCCYADTNETKEGRAKNRRAEIMLRP